MIESPLVVSAPASGALVEASSVSDSALRRELDALAQSDEFGRLPDRAKHHLMAKLGAMLALSSTRRPLTTEARMLECVLTAKIGRGFSAPRLLNDYCEWRNSAQNWRVLVNAALAPQFRQVKKTGGVLAPKIGDGCQVPPETADWWVKLAESFQRNSAAGWRRAQQLWRDSWHDTRIVIPGYGNAREYWAKRSPSALTLATCPPELPRGWQRSTFYAKLPPRWESSIARVGSAYARSLLPGVPATRKGARYMEWVFFDDKWHEFSVVVEGQDLPCRLLELGALDYATGEYICWGFRPELPGEHEGDSRVRLKEQDMKWLVATLFEQEGFPRDYDCHLICERGTAVLREGPAQALFNLSGGRIKTCYTEMQGGTRLIWTEKKKGNSRGKAPLESLHSYLKNESANLPGQTGVDHERQPATLPAQIKEAKALIALGALMPAQEREKLRHHLLRYDEATEALDNIYRRANARTEHHLEGIERDVVGWRMGEGQPFTWTRELPADVHALSRVSGFEVRTRRPSPLELKHRLKDGQVFMRVPDWAWPQFFDHTQRVSQIKGNEIRFQRGGKELIFWPDANDPAQLTLARDMEQRGEKLLGFVNDRQPDRLYLLRENGAYFATWERIERASRGDREAHAALRGRVEKTFALAQRNVDRRSGAEQQRQLQRAFDNGRLLVETGAMPGPDALTQPGADLAQVIAADRAEQRRIDARKERRNRARILPSETFSAADEPAADQPTAPTQETPAAENGEGFEAGSVQHQPNRPARRRILDATAFI